MKRGDPVGCVGERIGYPESVHHRSDEDEVERSELGNMGLASASPSDHLTCFYHIQHIHYCIYLYYRIIRHRPYSITVYSNTGEMGRKIWKFSQTRHNHYGRVAARRRPSKRNNRSGKKNSIRTEIDRHRKSLHKKLRRCRACRSYVALSVCLFAAR